MFIMSELMTIWQMNNVQKHYRIEGYREFVKSELRNDKELGPAAEAKRAQMSVQTML